MSDTVVREGWHTSYLSIPFNQLPVGALFTSSMFWCDETRLRQKVDEDRWARLYLDPTAEGSDRIRFGFQGRSSTARYYQCEWFPFAYDADGGPDFMLRLLDTTGVPVVGLST